MAQRERVGVREIRQNLSVYLERVKAGEALEITEHGTPVAVLAPMPKRSSVIGRLVAEGRATPPSAPHATLPPPPRVKLKVSISEALQRMREDRL